MSDDLLTRVDITELLELQNSGLALSDSSLKIFWFNKSFKKILGSGRIKGATLNSLFQLNLDPKIFEENSSKSYVVPLPALGMNLILNTIQASKKNKPHTLLVELAQLSDSGAALTSEQEQIKKGIKFQKELQDILVLLVKEKSVDAIAEEILTRSVENSKSNFGIVTLIDNEEISKFVYQDNGNHLNNKSDIEKSIKYNSSFINKWLEINKRPLIALNQLNNIGFGIVQSLEWESVVIAPCYFDNVLQAKIILGKKKNSFSTSDISNIEQFSTILSFAISNIKTRELNSALESRLLQAQKLETIGKLSSGMAHDFNNLLSSIFGSVNLLRNRVEKTENVTKLIDNIENCSIRARDLTKGLLSFGKPTPKRKELVFPNNLLTELIKVINQTLPRNITIDDKVGSNLYTILGNSTEIYQILLNLCVNAKEAINGRGKITVVAANVTIDDSNSYKFPFLEKGNYVQFSVTDTGVGIEEEHISRIFDPYFSTKSKDTGSGLGLYVTYGIIKAHNGHVEVSSRKGEGTTFDVFIPAFEPNKIDRTKDTNKIIMLADDEEMLSDLLAEMLESTGYYVIKVKSSEEALRVMIEEIKIDLLVIDYNMPEMNGLDCVAELRKKGFDMPVILSSGSLTFDDKDLKKHNIDSKLLKPYEFDAMLRTIQKLI